VVSDKVTEGINHNFKIVEREKFQKERDGMIHLFNHLLDCNGWNNGWNKEFQNLI